MKQLFADLVIPAIASEISYHLDYNCMPHHEKVFLTDFC